MGVSGLEWAVGVSGTDMDCLLAMLAMGLACPTDVPGSYGCLEVPECSGSVRRCRWATSGQGQRTDRA